MEKGNIIHFELDGLIRTAVIEELHYSKKGWHLEIIIIKSNEPED